jgi:hypothetical protein
VNEWIGSLALFDRSIAIAEGTTNRTDHTSFLTIIVQSDINYDYNSLNILPSIPGINAGAFRAITVNEGNELFRLLIDVR